MTTAQERRRARRIARRAAQERGVPEVAPEVVTEVVAEVVTEVVIVEESTATRTHDGATAAPPVEEHLAGAPAADRNGMHHWVAVKPVRPNAAPETERVVGQPQKRWVAVKPRGATAGGIPAQPLAPEPAPEPKVPESLEALPRDPGDDTGPFAGAVADDGAELPASRALHPRSRAIRITRVKTNGKRRWSLDFLVRAPDAHIEQQ